MQAIGRLGWIQIDAGDPVERLGGRRLPIADS